MHVVMVTPFIDRAGYIDGGVAGVSKYLADEFMQRGDVKVTIIVPRAAKGQALFEQYENFTVHWIAKTGPLAFLPTAIFDLFAGKRQMKSLLRQLKPDLVHFQGFAFLAANCQWPSVLTIHGIAERDALWDKRKMLRWLKWLFLRLKENYGRRRVEYLIAISEYTKKFLPIKNKIRKVWFLENPIAGSYFNVNWEYKSGRIFCCTKLTALKNMLGMIRAFILIKQRLPDIQLRIAGSITSQPAYFAECQKVVKEAGLEDSVHFLGNISTAEVQSELSKANCFVLPSFQEVVPLVIEEAMAVGVPVVASSIGGIPYMVEDGKTGYLIDPYDTKVIAETVEKIIANPSITNSMSQQARQIARCRFTVSAVAEKTLEIYQDILGTSTRD